MMASKLSLFFTELKRRKVTRVAVVYALVGLGVIEGASMILPTLQLEAGYPFIVVFVLFGFPIALVLAWALEVTPQGIQKTAALTPEQLALQTPARWSTGSWVLSGIGLAVVLGAGYFVFFRGAGEVALPEGRVAVFPFENLTGDSDLDGLGPYAAHWITDGLTRVEGVKVLNSNAVLQAAQSRSLGSTDLEIAADLGAGTLVSGVYSSRGENLEFSAQITEVSSGNVLRSVASISSASEKEAVVDDLRDRVMGSLAIAVDDVSQLSASNPPTYVAYQAYLRSMRSIYLGNFPDCAQHASEAFRSDSTFLTALTLEGACYSSMGRWASQDSLLAVMEARRDEMAPTDRLRVDYQRSQRDGDLEAVLRATRLLASENPFESRGLAMVAMQVGRPEEALQAMAELPGINPFFGLEDPSLAMVPNANLMLGRYDAALQSVAELPPTAGEHLLIRQFKIHALIGLGRLGEIRPLLDEIEGMEPETAGWSPISPAQVYRNLSAVFARVGHRDEARETAERAIAWYRNRDPTGSQSARAQALFLAERPEEALGLLIPLVEDNPESLAGRVSLGIALALTGDEEGAEAQVRWIEELASPSNRGSHAYSMAAILAHLDHKDEAVRLLREALAQGRPYVSGSRGPLLWCDPNFRPLWGYETFERLIAPKG